MIVDLLSFEFEAGGLELTEDFKVEIWVGT